MMSKFRSSSSGTLNWKHARQTDGQVFQVREFGIKTFKMTSIPSPPMRGGPLQASPRLPTSLYITHFIIISIIYYFTNVKLFL